ncbi:hypothetical protein [Tateyamaria pelophila]|uniref:hypothetical protein n=1 Tax=Tateyamaria pelophila TaxID=328415 RepID=UPI001CBA89E7|nr:hypothetical protein [Tateyamaria pelophila]
MFGFVIALSFFFVVFLRLVAKATWARTVVQTSLSLIGLLFLTGIPKSQLPIRPAAGVAGASPAVCWSLTKCVSTIEMIKERAVWDDLYNIAREMGDWSKIDRNLTGFHDRMPGEALVEAMRPSILSAS